MPTSDQKTTTNLPAIWADYQQNASQELRNLLLEHFLHLVKFSADRLAAKLPDEVEPSSANAEKLGTSCPRLLRWRNSPLISRATACGSSLSPSKYLSQVTLNIGWGNTASASAR